MTQAVSVIIPVFNRASVLGEAVASVLSQEGVSVKVIIVDDCSSDGSLEVARRIAASSSEVTVSSLAVNQGPAAARNRGLEIATSEFVTFLDSDDLMTAGRLKAQLVEIAIRPNCLVVGCQDIIVGEGVSSPALIVAELANADRHYVLMSMLGSKKTFEKIGHFDESYRVAEDSEYMVRAVDLGVEVHRVDKVFLVRRILGDNLVNDGEALSAARVRIYREHFQRMS